MISDFDLDAWTKAGGAETATLRRLEQAAIAAIQKRTGRYLGIAVPAFAEIVRFRGWPLQLANEPTGGVVTSLEQWDGSAWSPVAATDYYVSGSFIWPNATRTVPTTPIMGVPTRYRATYPAGYAGADDVWAAPADVQQAVLLLVGHWFENREAAVVGAINAEVQLGLDWLLQALTPATV
jgi:hypothetical protein